MTGIVADGWDSVALRRYFPGFQIVSQVTKNMKRIEKLGEMIFVLRRLQIRPRKTEKISGVDRPCCGWLGFTVIRDIPKFRVKLEFQVVSQAKKNIKRIGKSDEVEFVLRMQ